MKLYKLDDTELDELISELASRPQPQYFYEYEDDNGDTWLLVSSRKIDEDDVEGVFREQIENQAEEDDEDEEWD